jgi:hypothetical protein
MVSAGILSFSLRLGIGRKEFISNNPIKPKMSE